MSIVNFKNKFNYQDKISCKTCHSNWLRAVKVGSHSPLGSNDLQVLIDHAFSLYECRRNFVPPSQNTEQQQPMLDRM